ncbi:pseudouridine synthase [Clostridia bacterium]|nr:pseudouridine synthase [Clostridia bacterium]
MDELQFLVESVQGKTRVDKWLSCRIDLSRSALLKLFEKNRVLVNGKAVLKSEILKDGDEVKVRILPPRLLCTKPQNIPLDVVFEDNDLIVINKKKGMVVHPAVGHEDGTLVNALLYHCGENLSGINGVIRPGIVHRIDKDTSGLLVVAKNDNSHLKLSQQIKDHSFCRKYRAVVYGNVKERSGVISFPIGRSNRDRKKMSVNFKNSKAAITEFKLLENFCGFSYIELVLKTGRTHQIRVHMAHCGYPVAGDPVYGPRGVITKLQGQCLHAKYLGFVHPTTNEYLDFDSELPDYFNEFLAELRGNQSK